MRGAQQDVFCQIEVADPGRCAVVAADVETFFAGGFFAEVDPGGAAEPDPPLERGQKPVCGIRKQTPRCRVGECVQASDPVPIVRSTWISPRGAGRTITL
jgi:hypothetical protein